VAAPFAAAQGAAGPRVQPLSLEISKPTPPGTAPELEQFLTGTRIRLLISLPDRHIVEADHDASKLTYTDDMGTDLTKVKGAVPGSSGVLGGPTSKDGKQCRVDASAPGVPVAGASSVKVSGKIVLLCGSEEKTTAVENVVLNDKLDAVVGPFSLVWDKEAKNVPAGSARVVFVWSTKKHIRSVKFLSAAGKELKATEEGWVRFSVNGDAETRVAYRVAAPREGCTVRVTYFDKMEPVTVPVDLTIGVGF
jgi:hypothetical protein